ncbi:MAG TPA: Hsp20/alpha crystallin family protein [Acidimicrobiia bacterium]|nr:Hsp20/alpha crystallin family protein [Acidimicrobiia bacterium]
MLMRFDPFSDFDRLSRQVWGQSRANFMPADAYRKGERFYLHLDLPGVDPDSIDITVEKNNLTVTAERRFETSGDEQMLLNERPAGSYSRQFFLGESLDTDAIEAGYDHGVLTVTIPIAETAKARKISVNTVTDALPA